MSLVDAYIHHTGDKEGPNISVKVLAHSAPKRLVKTRGEAVWPRRFVAVYRKRCYPYFFHVWQLTMFVIHLIGEAY